MLDVAQSHIYISACACVGFVWPHCLRALTEKLSLKDDESGSTEAEESSTDSGDVFADDGIPEHSGFSSDDDGQAESGMGFPTRSSFSRHAVQVASYAAGFIAPCVTLSCTRNFSRRHIANSSVSHRERKGR